MAKYINSSVIIEVEEALEELSAEIWGIYTSIDDLKKQAQDLTDKLQELQILMNKLSSLPGY